jgi:hypothetical protein
MFRDDLEQHTASIFSFEGKEQAALLAVCLLLASCLARSSNLKMEAI